MTSTATSANILEDMELEILWLCSARGGPNNLPLLQFNPPNFSS